MGRRKIELSGAEIAGKIAIDMESQFHIWKNYKSIADSVCFSYMLLTLQQVEAHYDMFKHAILLNHLWIPP